MKTIFKPGQRVIRVFYLQKGIYLGIANPKFVGFDVAMVRFDSVPYTNSEEYSRVYIDDLELDPIELTPLKKALCE